MSDAVEYVAAIPLKMTLRNERPDDYAAILRLTYEAFLTLDYPGRRRMDEHYLIYLLRGSDSVIPGLGFVAELDGQIVGHILYTKSKYKRLDGRTADTITFGPLSVLPEYQRRGIGAALVRYSMEKAREMGFKAVLITGVPDYYPKLGFRRAREYGLTLDDGTAPDFLMAYELIQGYLHGGGVLCEHAPEFDIAENDDAGYEKFHKRYMTEHFPARLILRPLFESDIALIKRWLYAPHVARWFHYPEEWMESLESRHGEFGFITPLIAEYEGEPIGFCRYYDCFPAKAYPHWNEELPSPAVPNETYSMDCLIGEPDYLRRGLGKEMTALMLEELWKVGAKTVIVQPERENTASCRALEANGFKWNGKEYSLGRRGVEI